MCPYIYLVTYALFTRLQKNMKQYEGWHVIKRNIFSKWLVVCASSKIWNFPQVAHTPACTTAPRPAISLLRTKLSCLLEPHTALASYSQCCTSILLVSKPSLLHCCYFRPCCFYWFSAETTQERLVDRCYLKKVDNVMCLHVMFSVLAAGAPLSQGPSSGLSVLAADLNPAS